MSNKKLKVDSMWKKLEIGNGGDCEELENTYPILSSVSSQAI